MANDGYRARQDILQDHMNHIQDLGKDNQVLNEQLESAASEIRKLNSKIKRLEDELSDLLLKVKNVTYQAQARSNALPIRITRGRFQKPH